MPIEIAVGGTGYDWWDLVPAIVGGVIGALAGGIPAWLLATRGSKETLARDRLAREDADFAAVFRIHTKLGAMVNDLVTTVLQIREMLERPFDPRDESPTQRRVSAFAGKQARRDLTFAPEELSVLVSAEKADFLTELDLFSRRYLANMVALEKYGEMKEALQDALCDCDDIQFGPNDVIMTSSQGSNANKIRLKARTLESVIVPLIEMMERDARHGVDLAEQFADKVKPHFPNRKVPGFS